MTCVSLSQPKIVVASDDSLVIPIQAKGYSSQLS